jgi:glutathione peroxidase
MKTALFFTALLASSSGMATCPDYLDTSMRKLHSSEELNFCESFADKPMLIVNTASHCGYTPQFNGLEALHKKYADQGLVVVGFASNDFRQEAKDEAEAAHVCYKNYGVSFTMMAPSHVKGEQANAVFKAMAEQSKAPGWNFNKYLLDGEGNVVQHYGSSTTPESGELKAAIEQLL